jgi:hypothetical protein
MDSNLMDDLYKQSLHDPYIRQTLTMVTGGICTMEDGLAQCVLAMSKALAVAKEVAIDAVQNQKVVFVARS